MVTFVAFFSGVVCGIMMFIVGLATYGAHITKKNKALQAAKDSVSERLKKVRELTKLQFDLHSKTDGPQKNSLDGKYKNSLIREIKSLEEEKIEIMQSIIKDGFDPEVTTVSSDGSFKNLKLSELLGQDSLKEEKKELPKKPTHKFTVHDGGKFDTDDGNGGETIH